ncbi:DUF4143 domain-containing protein [candidate division KSB1 bacterium]|nr:DUF4143 domain-containing protein [candidate division KSB1 bacterium]
MVTLHQHIFDLLKTTVSQERIQVLIGARNVGKKALIDRWISYLQQDLNVPIVRIFHYEFDDVLVQLEFPETLSELQNQIEKTVGEPIGELAQPIYLIFEQIQNLMTLFENMSQLHQLNPQKIKMILTSSINLTTESGFQKHLAGQSQIHRLDPITLRELIGTSIAPLDGESVLATIVQGNFDLEYFLYLQWLVEPYAGAINEALRDYLLFGGLPAIYQHTASSVRWEVTRDFLRRYFERDLRLIYQITDLKKFKQILYTLSLHNGQILNLLNLTDDYGFNRNTMRKYTGIMRDTLLLDFVNPYLKDVINKPVMRTPKLYFLNTGLVNLLNNHLNFTALETRPQIKSTLETVLYLNLRTILDELSYPIEIAFLRDYQEHELDFLISTPKGLIPIGISYFADDCKFKIKTFRYYLRYCQKISNGVIFGNFDRVEQLEMRGSKLFQLPLWMLW